MLVFLVAGKLVEPGNEAVLLGKVVAALALLLLFAAEQLKVEAKLFAQFVLPLFRQRTGRHDEHASGIGAHGHLANQQTGHDGFAGTGVVGQHKAQGLAGQHGFVHGGNLMGQRLYVGGVHRHHGVEQVRQADAIRLKCQFEAGGVGIKRPGFASGGQGQAVLVAAKQGLLVQLALGVSVSHQAGVGANLFDVDQPHQFVGQKALYLGVFFQFFKFEHGPPSPASRWIVYDPISCAFTAPRCACPPPPRPPPPASGKTPRRSAWRRVMVQ